MARTWSASPITSMASTMRSETAARAPSRSPSAWCCRGSRRPRRRSRPARSCGRRRRPRRRRTGRGGRARCRPRARTRRRGRRRRPWVAVVRPRRRRDLLDRPRHVRRGQVVEQHAVGDLAGQLQHAGFSAPMTTLGLRSPSRTPSRKRLHVVEVALEDDRLAGEALPDERDVLADPGQRPVAVGGAVPLGSVTTGDEMPTPRRMSRSGCSACSVAPAIADERRGAQLQGEHAGAEVERRARRRRRRRGWRTPRARWSRPSRTTGSRAPRPTAPRRGRRRGRGS